LSQAKFKFVSDAIGGDQLTVVSFTGREQVSELYRYEIEVKAPLSADIDLDDVLDASARFVTEQNGVEFPVNGILSSFEEFKTVQNYAHYKAVLVPSIWKLSNYKTNEIFYQAGDEGDIDAGLSITEIITQVLEKSGMTSADFDLGGLSSKLLKREYTCQYGESDFDFISRLLENEGVFYYFEQSATEEKIVFVNDLNYLSLPQPKLIFDVAAMANSQDNGVFAWSCRKQRLAERVVVRNYNPEEPSLDVSETTAIDGTGQGTEYIYGQNVQTDTEATYLSQIRAEEHICRKTQFFGESSVTRLQAGYLFLLDQHPNTKYNAIEYLAIEVNHEGHNLDMSIANDANKQTRPQYQNSFVAISAEVQYRPPLKTIKPRITGNLHARIDGELMSEYAQLDSEGRYKVSMPFDFHNDDHPEGLRSARVRMMQPYAGKNRGMQFPMAKGTEVLLSFVDGDPDRPIIAGAINTAAAPGPVTADNQTESVIQTGGNNKIRFEDKAGSERIVMQSPRSNSWLRIGAPNDPVAIEDSDTTVDGVRLQTAGSLAIESGLGCGEYFYEKWPAKPKDLGGSFPAKLKVQLEELFVSLGADAAASAAKFDDKGAHIFVSTMNYIKQQSGDAFDVGSGNAYNFGNGYTENYVVMGHPYDADFKFDHDLLDAAGSGWTKVDFTKLTGLTEGDVKVPITADRIWPSSESPSKEWENDYTAVEKTVGDSYEITIGNSIEISKGDSLEVNHGGYSIEVEYDSDGKLVKWAKGSPGNGDSFEKEWTPAGKLVLDSSTTAAETFISTDEKKYDRNTGALYAHSLSQGTGMGNSVFEFDYSNTVSMTFNTGSLISIESFLGGKLEIENSVGAVISVTTALGLIMETEFCPMTVKIDSAGLESTFPGIKTKLEATKMDANLTKITTMATMLENCGPRIGMTALDIEAIGSLKITA